MTLDSVTQDLLDRRHKLIGKHSPLFYDNPLHLVKGEDVWVFDHEGKRYLDVYNNVPHVGHCNPKVVSALTEQAATLNTHTRYLHDNILNYVDRLTSTFDDSLDMAMLTCTGSEANELALRMARYCTGGQGIIVTDFAYHGNTEAVAELGTAFMSESKTTKRVKSIPIPDTYWGYEGVAYEELADAYIAQLQKAIDEFAEEGIKLAGMLLCPDFANEGLLNLPEDFLTRAVDLVHKQGGVFIADEVQAGFGRSGKHWWAHQRYNVVPDIVTMGKPMGNGHPIGGVVAKGELIEKFGASSMYFNTFGGNPVSCAVGMAVLDVLESEYLLENAIETGAYVTRGLQDLQKSHEVMGEVRDLGMFFGVEMVRDGQPAPQLARRVINHMRNNGVLISTIGKNDSILKLRPAMTFRPKHAEVLFDALDKALIHACKEVE